MSDLKKTVVFYSIGNGGDGSAHVIWFLEEAHADRDQDEMTEGWGESCTGSAQTYVGSDIYKEAQENSKRYEGKHDYLKREEYYETRSVNAGKKVKTCEVCHGIIKIGQPSDMHHFYPEFNSYATHPKCSKKFMESLN